MKLKITLELKDAHVLYSTFASCPIGFGRRVALAVRDAEVAEEEAEEKPACPALNECTDFLLYVAALGWWYDCDAERICRRLRKEWVERTPIPGINRPFYSDAFPASFTVEGISRLLELATAAFNKLKEGKEEADHA